MKIWTDDEYIEVDPNDVGQLEAAMLFKAEHIKAKADPELFVAVAEMLSRLWDSAMKRVDVVRCRECKHWKPSGSKAGNSFSDMEYIGGCEFTNYCRRESDFCSYGERKEGAD